MKTQNQWLFELPFVPELRLRNSLALTLVEKMSGKYTRHPSLLDYNCNLEKIQNL
jgi:hypothetical protein